MSREGKKFFIGALVGTVLGGMTALLFAPKSGLKMRKDIARTTRHAADKAQDIVHDVSSKTQSLVHSLNDQVHDLADKAQGIAEKAKEAVETISATTRRMRRK